MLKYIFGAVFIALAWALVLVFRDTIPMWPAIVATIVIVLGLAAWVLIKMFASKRAASSIEKGLSAAAARDNEGMRPDLQAQIVAMQAEFQKAVSSLKSSKVGRSGRDALGLLPWYVIIGPPGSGKTTAIRSSGLKFPQGRNSVVKGVGGTRNCDWWMTNEAIILDTAGRWSTEDDDAEEWLAFLDLLKKTRPKKPQRHHGRGQRQGAGEEPGGDRRACRKAARAHRRGHRAPGDGRARLPAHHDV